MKKIITQNFKEPQSPLPLRGSQTAHTKSIKTPVVIASIKSACPEESPTTGLVTQTPEPVVFKMLYGATTCQLLKKKNYIIIF